MRLEEEGQGVEERVRRAKEVKGREKGRPRGIVSELQKLGQAKSASGLV